MSDPADDEVTAFGGEYQGGRDRTHGRGPPRDRWSSGEDRGARGEASGATGADDGAVKVEVSNPRGPAARVFCVISKQCDRIQAGRAPMDKVRLESF